MTTHSKQTLENEKAYSVRLTFLCSLHFLHEQVTALATPLCRHCESRGGNNINMKPPTIKSVAGNFHPKKFSFLNRASTAAFSGMPSTVPREMKSGKVYAIPKLILKLKTLLSTELMHK